MLEGRKGTGDLAGIWRNSGEGYGLIAIVLHWLIAIAIIGLLGLGTIMVDLRKSDPSTFELYQLHKSIGITVLVLSLARLGWRIANQVPPLPSTLRPWEVRLARLTHVGFYILMIAMPLSGWMMVSASPWNIPTVLYGVVELPHLPVLETLPDKKAAEGALKSVHELLAWGAAGLLALHVAGALKHQFVLRDGAMARMLPRPALWRTAPDEKDNR